MTTAKCVCGQTAEEFFTHDDDCAVWLDGVKDYVDGNPDEAMCEYCQERPVFEHFTSACFKCSFVCARCEELTGYDRGMAYDELCDDCGELVGSTPENPWKGE